MNTRKYRRLMPLLTLLLLLMAACAPGDERFVTGAAGFWAGLWHGLICIVTLIISLFTDSVRMYEVSNTSAAKNTILQEIEAHIGHPIAPTNRAEEKFNIFLFRPEVIW